MKTISSLSLTMLVVLITLIVNGTVKAQNVEDIFNGSAKEITWLGVDFTQVRLMGDLGTVSTIELLPLFDQINLLIISESEKYDFNKALRKSEIPFDLSLVDKINSNIDVDKLIIKASSYDNKRIDEKLISNIVKQYNFDKQDGIGLVFFMELLDKTSETGTMWVTFFNLSDYEVLITERMKGGAGGFGFRNHWANTVYEVIKEIKRSKYEEWMALYAK
jgi:hypothetical protein